jgi:hypothetical protein
MAAPSIILTQSQLDPILDKPWVNFVNHLDEIERGSIRINESPFVTFLASHIQQSIERVGSVGEAIQIIKNAYKFEDVVPFWKNLYPDVLSSTNNIPQEYTENLNFLRLLEQSLKNRDWDEYDKCVLQEGTSQSFELVMMLTFKRFHRELGMNDFLYCEIAKTADERASGFQRPISRQMIASRMNFILNGIYLPIVINVSIIGHSTSCLLIPIVSVDKGHVVWHLIDINTNSHTKIEQNQFTMISRCSDEYAQWLGDNQVHSQTSYREYYCVKNIQKGFGTCSYWSKILAFQFFIDFCRFQDDDDFRGGGGQQRSTLSLLSDDEKQQSLDTYDRSLLELANRLDRAKAKSKISVFCENLAKRTKMLLIINRFNNYIADLAVSFLHLNVQTTKLLKDKNREGHFPTKPEIGKEILHGSHIISIVELTSAILRTVGKIREHLRKYYDKPPVPTKRAKMQNDGDNYDSEFETDEETTDEKQRQLEIAEHKQRKAEQKQRQAEEERRMREEAKMERENLQKRNDNKELLQDFLLKESVDTLRFNRFLKDKFIRAVDDFFKLNSGADLPQVDINFRRFLGKICYMKKNEEERVLTHKIDILQKSIDEMDQSIARYETILEKNPDAPSEIVFLKWRKQTMKDDLETKKEMIIHDRGDLEKLRDQLAMKQSITLDTLVNNVLTLIGELRDSETGKHPRDED